MRARARNRRALQFWSCGCPCKIVRAGRLRASVSTHSGGSFEGVRVNSFGWVIRARSFEGGSFEGIRVNSFGQVIWVRVCSYKKC